MTNNESIDSYRKISLTAGVLYLLTFISIPTLSLYTGIHNSNYITGPGPDTPVFIGGILEIIVALTGIGTAVVLYPILKRQNGILSLGLVSARVLEASTIFAGVAILWSIVTLRQAGVGEDAETIGHTLAVLYDRFFFVGQSFIPAVDDLLLGFLLYRSRLVPRTLALIGIVGAPLLICGDIAILFGLIEQRTPSAMVFAILVALFEFSLGIWLIVKGFNPSAPLIVSAKTKNHLE